MADARSVIAASLQAAFDALEPGADPVLRGSERADFQANGALALAKRLDRQPREVAAEVLERADLSGVCSAAEVSGPGFINLEVSSAFLAGRVAAMLGDPRLGVDAVAPRQVVVVDYSAPNVAKEMHVGHLRTTVIGDALCRMLDFAGHRVVRENHIGDWGTPFGMLIEHIVDLGEEKAVDELSVGDLNGFYQEARSSFDGERAFAERSRRRVVLLQSGDPETLRLWRILVDESIRSFDGVYKEMGVLLTDDDVVGESFYNPMLGAVVEDLAAPGLLVENDGAQCVFPPGFSNRRGEPLPLIVRKSDGGYGYAATDLAAIRDRVDRVRATRILYVVGAPQAQHLQMCFAVARMAGWLPEGTEAVHVSFGSVLGPDHKMLRSRTGESLRLADLLDEAVERAWAAMGERGEEMSPVERGAVAHALGIGAVKYADLSTERTRDYVFDWDRMLSLEGNTAPYLQYAHARIRSIFRRAAAAAEGVPVSYREVTGTADPPVLGSPHERSLALALDGYSGALQASLEGYSPSRLCTYLYDLSSTFTTFYENCPVLRAPDDETRRSRLALADLTARVLAGGLGLLGIDAPERM
jgi:arginyl-tRNA synthetase